MTLLSNYIIMTHFPKFANPLNQHQHNLCNHLILECKLRNQTQDANCYELRKMGFYDMVNKKRRINDSAIYWGGEHGVPRDSIERRKEIQKPNIYIQISLIIFAVLGQLMAMAFLAVNIKYRNTRCVPNNSLQPLNWKISIQCLQPLPISCVSAFDYRLVRSWLKCPNWFAWDVRSPNIKTKWVPLTPQVKPKERVVPPLN